MGSSDAQACGAILAWLRDENVGRGTAVDLALPPRYANAARDGRAHAARTADGRLFVLLKKRIGWKDNFEGVVCTDEPVADGELVLAPNGRTYLALPGLGLFEELYVRRAASDVEFEAYFDLN